MSQGLELTQGELHSIFQRSIQPELEALRASEPEAEPTLILVGAQPGAGKTRTVGRAQQDHAGALAVVGDDLRVFHPDYARLMREEPLRMPEVTAQAAGAWARMSSDYLRDRQASVVFETTFRQPDAVVATAKEFRDAGYRVEVRALAVPEAVSRLGVLSRYAEQVRDQGVGRWTPQAFHDVAAEQMPKSLERVIAEGHVDRVLVVDRAGRALYAADIDAAAASSPAAGHGAEARAEARAAVDAGRRIETLGSEASRAWLGTFDRDANFVLDRADIGSDVLATIDDLRRDGDRIAGLAHAPDSPEAADAASKLADLGDRTSAARDALEHSSEHTKPSAPGITDVRSRLTTKLETTLNPGSNQRPAPAATRAQQPTLDHDR